MIPRPYPARSETALCIGYPRIGRLHTLGVLGQHLDTLDPPPLGVSSFSLGVRVRHLSELGMLPVLAQDYPALLAEYRQGDPVEQRYLEMVQQLEEGTLARVSSNDPKFSAVLDQGGELVALRLSRYLYCQAFEQALAAGATVPSLSPAHLGAGVYCFVELEKELYMLWHRKASSVHGAGLLHPILYGGYVEVSDSEQGVANSTVDLEQCLRVARVREASEELGNVDEILRYTEYVVMINETPTGNFPVQVIAFVRPGATLEDFVSTLRRHNEQVVRGEVVGAKLPEVSQLVLVPFNVDCLEQTQDIHRMRGVLDPISRLPIAEEACRIAPQGAQFIASQPFLEGRIRTALLGVDSSR